MGEFDELKRLADAATPGGWAVVEQKYPHRYMGHHIERMIVTAYDDGQLKSPYPIVATATGVGIGDKPIYFCHISEENAAYIAAANPATILALIARLEAAEAELDRLRSQEPVGETYINPKTTELKAHLYDSGFPPPRTKLYAEPKPPAHKGATHCENCGCTWLDDGLNPVGCPYCKKEQELTV